jgi:hypothetical protein
MVERLFCNQKARVRFSHSAPIFNGDVNVDLVRRRFHKSEHVGANPTITTNLRTLM